ncbi:uncharacterized protein LOC18427637 isoform X1 [Amborella trichopoda]|uniref:uncharacterized protein LOC18427637 isoform X1 n=1 Tax=Amborella trichopoda TaxID=13333 RepID=UPI0009C0EB5E|nr:uncharacterized protein LOC18427637 isoform X1 [Amborella trichopoda]|eukprot:XP_020518847.1 uncharacterized protein LOC18427637 isoform X1 [Amborella trichopoda]
MLEMKELDSKRRANSNLERFLNCTTPSFPAQRLFKDYIHGSEELEQWGSFENGYSEYFRLRDLWNCYDEWSAYGAGVPVHLRTGEIVLQYYVPYLSALQIYTRTPITPTSPFSDQARDGRHSSDCDLRDLSGSDSESVNSNSSESRSSSLQSWCSNYDNERWEAQSDGNRENFWRPTNRLGYLYLEYMEHTPPYARVPFMDKINQLIAGCPELTSLRSIDLSPASWMSVAWYPIYHIPPSRMVRDLSACFLTYHTLSSSFQDGDSLMRGGDVRENEKNIRLEPFGLATYKLQGDVWLPLRGGGSEQWRLYALWTSSLSWLNQLQVHHPDFHFFLHHRD